MRGVGYLPLIDDSDTAFPCSARIAWPRRRRRDRRKVHLQFWTCLRGQGSEPNQQSQMMVGTDTPSFLLGLDAKSGNMDDDRAPNAGMSAACKIQNAEVLLEGPGMPLHTPLHDCQARCNFVRGKGGREITAALALSLIVLLAGTALQAAEQSETAVLQRGADFPTEDSVVWQVVEHGLKNEAADRALANAPDSPETFALLLDAYRPGDALKVLRRILDRRPERLGAALKVTSTKSHGFDDEGRGYPEIIRAIVAKARRHVRLLPREQAAEVDWYLRYVDVPVRGEQRAPWRDDTRDFVVKYAGTETALDVQQETLLDDVSALETFARNHTGTAIGARALYRAASRLASDNTVRSQTQRRNPDPTERLLRVAELARELQSGAYPDCESVRNAPELVLQFFASEPRYAKDNLPRVVAVFREFVLKELDSGVVDPRTSGIGYLIADKLPNMFANAGGDPISDVERFLIDSEAAADHAAALRYLRGLWYRQLAAAAKETAVKEEWRRKSDVTLLDLSRAGSSFYHRKALASLAASAFTEKRCDVASERYREYLSRFPRSEWAWVAGLRLGQCEQFRGNWVEARQAYDGVAGARGALPPARVIGYTFAGRASEALGDFQRARTAYDRAERAWDRRFVAPYYGTYQFFTRLEEEPCNGCDPRSKSDVSRDWLRERVAQLTRSFKRPGESLLERGRFLVTERVWWNAIAPLSEFIRLYPQSANAAEAHELLTRAKLEMALLRAGPDQTEENRRAALLALQSLAAQPYGFSVFASKVARATLQSMVDPGPEAAQLMSDALGEWHEHGVLQFARTSATALERDVMDMRDAVFHPYAQGPSHTFAYLRSSDSPPTFFIATPAVRVKLHDDSDLRIDASSRLCRRAGALLLDEDQIAVFIRILTSLGGTKGERTGPLEQVLKFWNRFFTIGPGHWGGWIVETFPIVGEVIFIDAARTRGAVRIRSGYQGSTQLLTKTTGTWKVTGDSGHWIE